MIWNGAHMGVSQSIADGYMGRCEMVWTTAGTNRVCGRCMELKDRVVGYTDESGVTIPPLHPRCRCAIMYREVGTPRTMQPKPRNTMSTNDDDPKWPPRDKSKIISKEEYVELRNLAAANSIALENVKKFDGSAKVAREIIETLTTLQERFPAIRNERYKLTLRFDDNMPAKDFAITWGKIIHLNANAYRDVEILAAEYEEKVREKFFVKGTTWRAIIYHEFGHVVADIYKLDPLKIAFEITNIKPIELFIWLKENLSEYAGSFLDGREIISEVFADISTGKPSKFSREFYDKVLQLTRSDKNV